MSPEIPGLSTGAKSGRYRLTCRHQTIRLWRKLKHTLKQTHRLASKRHLMFFVQMPANQSHPQWENKDGYKSLCLDLRFTSIYSLSCILILTSLTLSLLFINVFCSHQTAPISIAFYHYMDLDLTLNITASLAQINQLPSLSLPSFPSLLPNLPYFHCDLYISSLWTSDRKLSFFSSLSHWAIYPPHLPAPSHNSHSGSTCIPVLPFYLSFLACPSLCFHTPLQQFFISSFFKAHSHWLWVQLTFCLCLAWVTACSTSLSYTLLSPVLCTCSHSAGLLFSISSYLLCRLLRLLVITPSPSYLLSFPLCFLTSFSHLLLSPPVSLTLHTELFSGLL